jgi:hypothetical protein
MKWACTYIHSDQKMAHQKLRDAAKTGISQVLHTAVLTVILKHLLSTNTTQWVWHVIILTGLMK